MRTLTADIAPLSQSFAEGETRNWGAHGTSIVDVISAWYSAVVANAELAKLPPRLLSDIFSEKAPLQIDAHLRDGFGRPIY